jgi:hypothetical protein
MKNKELGLRTLGIIAKHFKLWLVVYGASCGSPDDMVEHREIDNHSNYCNTQNIFAIMDSFRAMGYVPMLSVYTKDKKSVYVGDTKWAWFLVKRGIVPVASADDHSVASIGWREKDQKWYGWSHRAIHGFGIGDIVAKGDLTATSGYIDEYLKDHPEADRSLPVGFVAKTLEDAKWMAIAFADAVS